MKEQLGKTTVNSSWNQFYASGSVQDYLNYVSGCKENMSEKAETDWVGDSPHAGVYRSNGNYIETDAYR